MTSISRPSPTAGGPSTRDRFVAGLTPARVDREDRAADAYGRLATATMIVIATLIACTAAVALDVDPLVGRVRRGRPGRRGRS